MILNSREGVQKNKIYKMMTIYILTETLLHLFFIIEDSSISQRRFETLVIVLRSA